MLKAEGISSPWRVACLGLKFSLSLGELDASLGEFRVRNLHEKTILPFLVALFLDLTNNHQNLSDPSALHYNRMKLGFDSCPSLLIIFY